jgi:predicted Na+-dependent transporter
MDLKSIRAEMTWTNAVKLFVLALVVAAALSDLGITGYFFNKLMFVVVIAGVLAIGVLAWGYLIALLGGGRRD